jgi:hypothetical protein
MLRCGTEWKKLSALAAQVTLLGHLYNPTQPSNAPPTRRDGRGTTKGHQDLANSEIPLVMIESISL